MFDSLKLSDRQKRHCAILREPSNTRPIVWRVEENGVRAIVKDFSVNKFLYRNIFGRFLVWREARAYKKLKNIKGVPTLYRVIDGLALVTEEMPGKTLGQLKHKNKIQVSFFDDLKDIVDRVHERGLVHCDLKRSGNILMGYDGAPYIIDWAASISENEFRFPIINKIYRRFVLDDYNAIVKQKLRHIPGLVTPEETQIYTRRSWVESTIRFLRDRLRAFIKKVA
ncbi:MAG: hypothetical protein JRJ15_05780 [Deltaproteobacteria bacterium]|nr:hypothetical protein [Deltaproteobacteria bacterium]